MYRAQQHTTAVGTDYMYSNNFEDYGSNKNLTNETSATISHLSFINSPSIVQITKNHKKPPQKTNPLQNIFMQNFSATVRWLKSIHDRIK